MFGTTSLFDDLPLALDNAKVTMYADDTSISYSSKSVDEINSAINDDLSNLKEWLEGNKLSLNVTKTQAIGTSGGNRSLTIKRRASTTTKKIIFVVFSACQFSISLFSHFQRFDKV